MPLEHLRKNSEMFFLKNFLGFKGVFQLDHSLTYEAKAAPMRIGNLNRCNGNEWVRLYNPFMSFCAIPFFWAVATWERNIVAGDLSCSYLICTVQTCHSRNIGTIKVDVKLLMAEKDCLIQLVWRTPLMRKDESKGITRRRAVVIYGNVKMCILVSHCFCSSALYSTSCSVFPDSSSRVQSMEDNTLERFA